MDILEALKTELCLRTEEGKDVTMLPEVIAEIETLQSQLRDAVALLKTYREALEYYYNHIPVYKVISEESAQFEKEYGFGKTARIALSAPIPESLKELLT